MEEEIGEVTAFKSFLGLAILTLTNPVWADQIIYLSSGKVYSVDLTTRISKVIIEPPAEHKVTSLLVLPESRQLVYVMGTKSKQNPHSKICTSKLDGGQSKELLKTNYPAVDLYSHSPDENVIAYQVNLKDSTLIGYLNLKAKENRQMPDSFSPQLIGNGKLFFCSRSSRPGFCYHLLSLWNLRSQKLDTLAHEEDICNRVVAVSEKAGLLAVVRSDAGTQLNEYIDILDLFTLTNPSTRLGINRNESGNIKISKLITLTGHIRFLNLPKFSPDGRLLLSDWEHWLHVTDLATQKSTRVADKASPDFFGWSPDGQSIFFTSQGYRGSDIYTADPDGSNLRRITNTSQMETHIHWID